MITRGYRYGLWTSASREFVSQLPWYARIRCPAIGSHDGEPVAIFEEGIALQNVDTVGSALYTLQQLSTRTYYHAPYVQRRSLSRIVWYALPVETIRRFLPHIGNPNKNRNKPAPCFTNGQLSPKLFMSLRCFGGQFAEKIHQRLLWIWRRITLLENFEALHRIRFYGQECLVLYGAHVLAVLRDHNHREALLDFLCVHIRSRTCGESDALDKSFMGIMAREAYEWSASVSPRGHPRRPSPTLR